VVLVRVRNEREIAARAATGAATGRTPEAAGVLGEAHRRRQSATLQLERSRRVIVYAVLDDALSARLPHFGVELEVFIRCEAAERFLEEARPSEMVRRDLNG
jgi:hypothetical protein